MVFQFDEQMMKTCLEANGWSYGWEPGRWVTTGINADYCDYSLKEAFEMLMQSKNLYGKQFQHGWRMTK